MKSFPSADIIELQPRRSSAVVPRKRKRATARAPASPDPKVMRHRDANARLARMSVELREFIEDRDTWLREPRQNLADFIDEWTNTKAGGSIPDMIRAEIQEIARREEMAAEQRALARPGRKGIDDHKVLVEACRLRAENGLKKTPAAKKAIRTVLGVEVGKDQLFLVKRIVKKL